MTEVKVGQGFAQAHRTGILRYGRRSRVRADSDEMSSKKIEMLELGMCREQCRSGVLDLQVGLTIAQMHDRVFGSALIADLS